MPGTRANPNSTAVAPAAAAAAPPPPLPTPDSTQPQPSRATAQFISAQASLKNLDCFTTAGSLGAAPFLDLDKDIRPDGSSASEGDRDVIAFQASKTAMKTPPSARNVWDVITESAKLENGSVERRAFLAQAAKKLLVEHVLGVVLPQGALLESAGSVLLHVVAELQQPGSRASKQQQKLDPED